MVRKLTLIFYILAGVFILNGCSNGNPELAKLVIGKNEYKVRMNDVKKDVLSVLKGNHEITNDLAWNKDFLFINYLSKDIAVLEEMNKGLTNSPDFKTRYGTLYEKGCLLALFSKGNELLIKRMRHDQKIPATDKKGDAKLMHEYAQALKKQNVIIYYTVNSNQKSVNLDSKSYLLDQLPQSAVLFKVFDKPYDWKESKRLILLFEPDFTNRLDPQNFQNMLDSLQDMALVSEVARKAGLDQRQKQEELNENYVRQIALEQFRKDLLDQVNANLTPKALKAFYEKNKVFYQKEKNGKMVQMTYSDARKKVHDELGQSYWQDLLKAWHEEMKRKYVVIYNENSIKTLIAMENKAFPAKSNKPKLNLALNKTAKASSIAKIGFEASQAFDGRTDTCWSPRNAKGSQWIEVDLGTEYSISQVSFNWGKSSPTSLKIQASTDRNTWNDFYSATKGVAREYEVIINPVKTRFVRLYIAEDNINKNYTLEELEVY